MFSLDSGVNPASRLTHVNQADSEKIGRTLIQAAYDMIGGSGDIAILSATSQATNQNLWIDYMKKELTLPKYANVKLVKIAYGDDIRDKSVSEAEGLLQSFPNLKCIIAPTTVGIAAAGKVLTDKGLGRQGVPHRPGTSLRDGHLHRERRLPVHVPLEPDRCRVPGRVRGNGARDRARSPAQVGDKFKAGRLGDYTITKAPDGGTEVLLGPPFKFDKANIADWKTVY